MKRAISLTLVALAAASYYYLASAAAALALSGSLTTLADSAASTAEKLGGTALIAIGGFLAVGHVMRREMGAVLGLLVLVLVPGLFLFDPSGAETLIKNTVAAL